MPHLAFYPGQSHPHSEEMMRLPLTGIQIRVGRHPSNDLTLPDDEISRFHAVIEKRSDGYWIQDQSRNGTFVQGKRVQQIPLSHQDEIRIGSWKIIFVEETLNAEKETRVKKTAKALPSFQGMIGRSLQMKKIFAMIEKVAPTQAPVLILGETGTGKELVAHALHDLSPRSRKNFVALNCGAISPQLIESELFGHERGSFTGAFSQHVGAFEHARGGTLFLDEIGELPLELQPKLLRVLEEKCFRRVGGRDEIPVDVRVVAATHRNIEGLVREGKFREDLYFRLYAVPLHLPPLRERKDDIPLLIENFCRGLTGNADLKVDQALAPEALKCLMDYPWRGNIRELKNVMMRSLLFASKNVLGLEDLSFLREESEVDPASLKSVEKDAILKALKENGWNKKEAAQALGVAKSTLFHKIRQYQIREK